MRFGNVSAMGRFRAVFAAIVCFLFTAAHAQLQNPGFEYLTGAQPSGWTGFGNVFSDQTQPRSGVRNLKIFGQFNGGSNTSGAYQNIPVKAGSRVNASVWAYNRSADPIAGDNYAILKVIYRNAANIDLASFESKRITAATPRNQWQLISASLGNAPAGSTQCAVFLLFVQPGSTPFASGAVIFDEVNLSVSYSPSFQLVWADEFNGTALDTKNWQPMIGDGTAYGIPGWGNSELQYYTDRKSNLNVTNGLLHIVARRENFGGKQYTSARLRTLGKFDPRYGRIEARIKVPAGQGLWSAFWMLPSKSKYGTWASSGEIDILETLNTTDRLYQTIHFGGASPNNASNGSNVFRASTFADGFHVYGIEWEPDSIRWTLDGQETLYLSSLNWYSSAALWNQRAPFDGPFHLLLNLAVGGNWPGSPNAGTPFPSEMQVDWVRCYQRKPFIMAPSLTLN